MEFLSLQAIPVAVNNLDFADLGPFVMVRVWPDARCSSSMYVYRNSATAAYAYCINS